MPRISTFRALLQMKGGYAAQIVTPIHHHRFARSRWNRVSVFTIASHSASHYRRSGNPASSECGR
jgi:hypothetical protein